MKVIRECSKPYCHERAVATLTYVYSEATLVIGPMATTAEPHSYDLCQHHVDTLKAPRGWTVQQLTNEFVPADPHDDDLDALAQVVRQASHRHPPAPSQQQSRPTFGHPDAPKQTQLPRLDPSQGMRVGHLRVFDGEGE